MAQNTKEIYLIRHGETEWSLAGKHTSTTDVPLTENGRHQASALQARLKNLSFAKILCSPVKRAIETCWLAGFFDKAEIDPDLSEWAYGEYEGLRTEEINRKVPGWLIFKDGAPGGESPAQVGKRADKVIQKVKAVEGNVVLFSSAHFSRVLAARWVGLNPIDGKSLFLSPASVSELGYEREIPVIKLWNDVGHIPSIPTNVPPAKMQKA